MRTDRNGDVEQAGRRVRGCSVVLDAIPIHAVVLDSAGCVVMQNERWREIWPEWHDCPFAQLREGEPYMDPWLRNQAAVAASGVDHIHAALHNVLAGELLRETVRVHYFGGNVPWRIELHVERPGPASTGVVVSHAPERNPHLDLLAHLQRVVSMSHLAGSLAHELSQPLMAIQANAAAAEKLLKAGPPDAAEALRAMEDISADCQRAAAVVARLRGFLRKSNTRLECCDINELALETSRLLRNEAHRHGVRVEMNLAQERLLCQGDPVQFQQALLNLLQNGIQAMSHKARSERKLHVSTSREGRRIVVAVRDCGDGIPEAHLLRIFDPFFTTSPGGLGLGLVITRSIVESFGGEIAARNHESGRGAVFEVVLPIAAN